MEKGKDLHLEGFCRHVQVGSAQINSIADMQRAVGQSTFKMSNPAGLFRSVYRDLCNSAQMQNQYSPHPFIIPDYGSADADT